MNACFLSVMIGGFLFLMALIPYLRIWDNPETLMNVTVYQICMLLDLILGICYGIGRFDASIDRKRLFLTILIDVYFTSLFGAVIYILRGRPEFQVHLRVVNSFQMVLTVLGVGFYHAYVQTFFNLSREDDARLRMINRVFAAIPLLIILFNLPTQLLFTVNESGYVRYGSLYSVYNTFNGIWYIFYVIMIFRKVRNRRILVSLLSYSIPVMIIVLVDLVLVSFGGTFHFDSLIAFTAFLSLFMIFCFVFVDHSREALRVKEQLAQSELNTVMLQINPHLIYNTLATIAGLCTENPKAAEEMTYRFSDYLRDNINGASSHPMISFRQELNHLQRYLSIEQIRFPNIHVYYDLETEDFNIPNMTLQPLVENAIKHGINKSDREEGTVNISTQETEDAWIVRVTDDGAGFTELPESKGGQHLGVHNVRFRLKALCEGSLKLTGVPGEGTVCEITLPKGANKK
ncbi:MAG: histidine kinase [Clostridia bacterium]|nr:histidine kinase [Clostridia bacterium]